MEDAWGPWQRPPNPPCHAAGTLQSELPTPSLRKPGTVLLNPVGMLGDISTQLADAPVWPQVQWTSLKPLPNRCWPRKPRPALICSPCSPCCLQSKPYQLPHSIPCCRLCCPVCSLHPPPPALPGLVVSTPVGTPSKVLACFSLTLVTQHVTSSQAQPTPLPTTHQFDNA